MTYDGVEYQRRHEALVSLELFDRVQRVLFNERRAGTRQRTHNHYLKGLVWCDRCQRRLMVMPGRSGAPGPCSTTQAKLGTLRAGRQPSARARFDASLASHFEDRS